VHLWLDTAAMKLTNAEIIKLKAIFPDGGRGFLESAGLDDSWKLVLADAPDAIRGGGDFNPWRLIIGLRDFWTVKSNWRAAYVGTQILLKYHQVGAGIGHPIALFEQAKLGIIASELGEISHAKNLMEPAWTGLLAVLGSDDVQLAPMAEVLGDLYLKSEDWEGAQGAYELSYRMLKGVAPDEPAQVAGSLADLFVSADRLEEAVPYLKESVEWFDVNVGHDAFSTVNEVQQLVTVLGRLRRIGEAVHFLDRWHEAILALPDSEDAMETRVHMGIAFHTVGRTEEAYRLVESAVRWTRTQSDTEGAPHAKLSGRLITLANLLDQRGHKPEAEGLIREALDVEQRAHGEQSGPVAIRYGQLADYLRGYGRGDEAAGWYEVAVTTMLDVFGPDHDQTEGTTERLVECLLEMCQAEPHGNERQDRIVAHLGRARHWCKLVLGNDHPLMNRVRNFEA